MVAPLADVSVVVTVTPETGSENDRPTVSGASSTEYVPGVVSSRRDCTRLLTSGAMRIVTPRVAGAFREKTSNAP
jgi:hypothetical protein